MKISIGADHAGYVLKQHLVEFLRSQGHDVTDNGTDSADSVDYPDFAQKVTADVAGGASERGILVCHTGIGMSMSANKVPGVRAALVHHAEDTRLTRLHNDANVLCLSELHTAPKWAEGLVTIFLETQFEGGRHARRVGKIESGCCPPAG